MLLQALYTGAFRPIIHGMTLLHKWLPVWQLPRGTVGHAIPVCHAWVSQCVLRCATAGCVSPHKSHQWLPQLLFSLQACRSSSQQATACEQLRLAEAYIGGQVAQLHKEAKPATTAPTSTPGLASSMRGAYTAVPAAVLHAAAVYEKASAQAAGSPLADSA
jgi:hypothetical protein